MDAGPCSVIAPCLRPPAITELDASNGPLPPWILLETRAYFAHRDDSTTAEAETSRGDAIKVSICLADPPARSYVCISCPGLTVSNFGGGEPRVVRTEKQLVLLRLPFTWSSEYYLYQATPGKKPTLSRIPDHGPSSLNADDFGICCGGDGEYVLAGLCPCRPARHPGGHDLHLYSSASKSWTVKPAFLENSRDEWRLPVLPHKVIPLGGGLLAWVDHSYGMLVCDVLSEDPRPTLRFIPLPGLLPGNTKHQSSPWFVRDVACVNGSLKIVEIQHFYKPRALVEETVVPCTIYDDQCFLTPPLEDLVEPCVAGWRAITWNRVLFDNCWRKGSEVHVRDLFVENPHHSSSLFPQLGDGTAGSSTMMDFLPSCPTLSIHGDDVVHMDFMGAPTHMISIDMRNKTLKTLARCPPAVKSNGYCPYFSSVLSKHLSNTPLHFQTPQQSFGYYESDHEYANCTYPSYGNYQQSFPLQQQPTYRPNWPQQQLTFRPNLPHLPSWTSPGSVCPVNAQPAYPVVNTTAFGLMVHPSPLNDYRMFQPPPPWAHMPPLPFNTMYLDSSTSSSGWQPYSWHLAPEPASARTLWTAPSSFIARP